MSGLSGLGGWVGELLSGGEVRRGSKVAESGPPQRGSRGHIRSSAAHLCGGLELELLLPARVERVVLDRGVPATCHQGKWSEEGMPRGQGKWSEEGMPRGQGR